MFVLLSGTEEAAVDVGIPFLLTALAMGIAIRVIPPHLPGWWPSLPETVVVFVLGGVVSVLHDSAGLGKLGGSLESWSNVHPHGILFLFLPPLLYESASAMDFHTFYRVSGQSLLLASVGVFISVAFTALVTKFVLPYEWDWGTSLLLASILSATDPVAVVAVLHTLGAPEKLSALIEGESLFNDGSAFVLFLIFKDVAGGHGASAGGMIGTFAQLSFGGPAFGLACALLLVWVLRNVHNDPAAELTAVIVLVFAVFFVAETVLHVSGVLAVVCFGLYMARVGKYALSREVEEANHHIWSEIGWVANTAVFVVSGAVIYNRVVVVSEVAHDPANWGYLILIYVLLHVIRAAMIAILFPLLRNMGYGLKFKEAAFMAYGGLRGAVGLALALMVELEPNEAISQRTKDLINFHTAGIVVLTVVINGMSAAKLYRWLHMYPASQFTRDMNDTAIHELAQFKRDLITELQHSRHHLCWQVQHMKYELVRALVPSFEEGDVNVGGLRKSIVSMDAYGHIDVSNMASVNDVFRFYAHRQKVKLLFQATMRRMRKRTHDAAMAGSVKEGADINKAEARAAVAALTAGGGDTAAQEKLREAFMLGIIKGSKLPRGASARKLDGGGGAGAGVSAEAKADGASAAANGVTGGEGGAMGDSKSIESGAGAGSGRPQLSSFRTPIRDGRAGGSPTPGSTTAKLRLLNASFFTRASGRTHAYLKMFNVLASSYKHQYEAGYISGDALLLLSEANDAGRDFAQAELGNAQKRQEASTKSDGSRHSGRGGHSAAVAVSIARGSALLVGKGSVRVDAEDGDVVSPFDSSTRYAVKKLEALVGTDHAAPAHLPESIGFRRQFANLRVALEVVSAWVHAHGKLADLAEHLSAFDLTIEREVNQTRARMLAREVVLEDRFRAMSLVLQTIVPAHVVIRKLSKVVTELENEEGVLDEHAAEQIHEALAHRLHELHVFIPDRRLITELLHMSGDSRISISV